MTRAQLQADLATDAFLKQSNLPLAHQLEHRQEQTNQLAAVGPAFEDLFDRQGLALATRIAPQTIVDIIRMQRDRRVVVSDLVVANLSDRIQDPSEGFAQVQRVHLIKIDLDRCGLDVRLDLIDPA